MTTRRPRIAFLISGRGSNMEAFFTAIDEGRLQAEPVLVVSNRADAAGLCLAQRASVASSVVDHCHYDSREEFDAELAQTVAAASPDLIILAGFMRILTQTFVAEFSGRLLNIHPSLLPSYPGRDTHRRAIENGDQEAGATVHYVTTELDGGPPVLQARVAIEPDDTPDSLAARVLPVEHQIFPAAAALHLSGRLEQRDNAAWLDGAPLPQTGLDWATYNPDHCQQESTCAS